MKFLKPGLILLLISALAAAALGFTNEVTKGPIAEQRQLARDEAMKAIIPDAANFEEVEPAKYYRAMDADGNMIGAVVFTFSSGFGGNIEVITGLSLDGEVLGVRMGNHSETPNLGSRAKEPEFYNQFTGLSYEEEIVLIKVGEPEGNEVHAISGATVTSKGMIKGVEDAIEYFKQKEGLN